MDYRELLIKYLAHVGFQEGTCFLGKWTSDGTKYLSAEDVVELRKLEKESEKLG